MLNCGLSRQASQWMVTSAQWWLVIPLLCMDKLWWPWREHNQSWGLAKHGNVHSLLMAHCGGFGGLWLVSLWSNIFKHTRKTWHIQAGWFPLRLFDDEGLAINNTKNMRWIHRFTNLLSSSHMDLSTNELPNHRWFHTSTGYHFGDVWRYFHRLPKDSQRNPLVADAWMGWHGGHHQRWDKTRQPTREYEDSIHAQT